MANISSTFKATKSRMVRIDHDTVSKRFQLNFGLVEGDYVEERISPDKVALYRILSVDECQIGYRGLWTAWVKAARMLKSGRVGVGRRLGITLLPGGELVSEHVVVDLGDRPIVKVTPH